MKTIYRAALLFLAFGCQANPSQLMTPSMPATNKWYAGMYAGVGLLNENSSQTDITIMETAYQPTMKVDHTTGYQLGGMIGYHLRPNTRLEGQLSYQHHGTHKVDNAISLNEDDTAIFVGSSTLQTFSGMLNLLVDLPPLSPDATPFIGAGIGYGYTQAKLSGVYEDTPNETEPSLNRQQHRHVFTYQAIAGFRFNVDNNTFVHFTSRYQGHTNPQLYQTAIHTLLLDVGYSVRFNLH